MSLPYANRAGQEGGVFVLPEILTPVHGFSFIPFSQAFPFLCLLATTILDSFFLLSLPNKPMQACSLFNPMCPRVCCVPTSPMVTVYVCVCVCVKIESLRSNCPDIHKLGRICKSALQQTFQLILITDPQTSPRQPLTNLSLCSWETEAKKG